MVPQMYEPSRHWLSSTVNTTWKGFCDDLTGYLEALMISRSQEMTSAPFTVNEPNHAGAIVRLWACLSHHWSQARAEIPTISKEEVVAQLGAAKGWTGNGNLGGDPINDVLLAELVIQRDPDATQLFHQRYETLLKGWISKTIQVGAVDCDICFSDFVEDLVRHLPGVRDEATENRTEALYGPPGRKTWVQRMTKTVLQYQNATGETVQVALHDWLTNSLRQTATGTPSTRPQPEDRWNRSAEKLSGYASPHASLIAYRGQCGLQLFLITCLKRFLMKWGRRQGENQDPRTIHTTEVLGNSPVFSTETTEEIFLDEDCADLFEEAFSTAFSLLIDRARRSKSNTQELQGELARVANDWRSKKAHLESGSMTTSSSSPASAWQSALIQDAPIQPSAAGTERDSVSRRRLGMLLLILSGGLKNNQIAKIYHQREDVTSRDIHSAANLVKEFLNEADGVDGAYSDCQKSLGAERLGDVFAKSVSSILQPQPKEEQ